jgi:osomolarity two-component system sensor histidine kinase SLN1
VRARAPSASSSDAQGSRPGSMYNNSVPDISRNAVAKVPGDITPTTGGFDKDAQPRLVGLSQPFFAAAPTPSPGKDSADQLAILDSVAASKDGGPKLRVLVAEDNLVNQEVVLR